LQVRYLYNDGSESIISQTVSAIAYRDTVFVPKPNKQNLRRVEVKIDPANMLTELSKANNAAELIVDWNIAKDKFLYPTDITKDIVAPILDVFFDGRTIANGEVVAPNPRISFVLSDDRFMSMDTSLLEIFIKPCADNSCDFQKLALQDMTLSQLSDRSFELAYTSELSASGTYELLVNAKDTQGASSSSAFTIQFMIAEDEAKVTVVSSPNPASDFVRFHAEGYSARNLQAIKYTIYDLKGIEQATQEFTASSASSDWYWVPNVSSGIYVYTVAFRQATGSDVTVSGKILIVK
jgi:hypothetical protein